MSTSKQKKRKDGDELLNKVPVTKKILLKSSEKTLPSTQQNKNCCHKKVFHLRIPMEAHIIALIKDGLS
jgi:hypothetical protein